MSKSAHDRALDVAARRCISWWLNAGRPPKPGDPHDASWPKWADGPILDAIEVRAREIAQAVSPDDAAFLAALHRLAADHYDASTVSPGGGG